MEYTKKTAVFCKNSDWQVFFFHRQHAKLLISRASFFPKILWIIINTFVTGSRVAACENATSVNGVGNGLDAMSEVNVRRWTSRRACNESCHKSSTNLY